MLIRDIRAYIAVIFHHWLTLLGGGFVIVGVGQWERYVGHNISTPLYWLLSFTLLVLAGFLAWRDEKNKRLLAEKELDPGRPKLTIRFVQDELRPNMNPQMWLENLGDRPATDITVDSIKRGRYEAIFPHTQMIYGRVGGPGVPCVNLIPMVTEDGKTHQTSSGDGTYFCDLMRENMTGKVDDTILIPVTIRFSDSGVSRVNTVKIMCERPYLGVSVGDQEF